MKKRPAVLKGDTYKVLTGCGNLYLTINSDEGEPVETRIQLGKSGSCVRSMLEVQGKLMSILLQHVDKGVIVKALKRHVKGVGCNQEFREGDKRYSSCLDKIAETLLIALKEDV